MPESQTCQPATEEVLNKQVQTSDCPFPECNKSPHYASGHAVPEQTHLLSVLRNIPSKKMLCLILNFVAKTDALWSLWRWPASMKVRGFKKKKEKKKGAVDINSPAAFRLIRKTLRGFV